MKKILFSAALVFGFATSAQAIEDCSKKTSDPEVFTCAEGNKNAAEKQLNKEYGDAKKRIDSAFPDAAVKKDYLNTFTEAQRGWLKYRDNQCSMVAHIADANTNPHIVFTNNCIAKMDEQRTKELSELPYDN